ncbi:carbohydrate-binding family 9-like protein [bacterium]|nr:carbohydrate-binding family 9-like protein [bacterium]
MRKIIVTMLAGIIVAAGMSYAQSIKEYTVKRAASPLQIDGKLTEPDWNTAPLTDRFVVYFDGSPTEFPTQAKMLWDDEYLYIAFIMTDKDVWGEMTSWSPGDPCLCQEEVAEVFIDPDGDGLNYIETEINPLKTVMDLVLSKEFAKKGKANLEWKFEGIKVGVWVDGTLNDMSDTDTKWVCELAFPFKTMAFSAPSMNFPPKNGDTWRLNLYRYEYVRTGEKKNELSAWNMTDKKRGFHAPDRFGKVIFVK